MEFYKVLEHPSDLKISVEGKILKELFANAGLAMADLQFVFEKKDKPKREDIIEIESIDGETLLVDFLSEILHLSDINNLAYYAFKFEDISENKIKCRIGGSAIKENKVEIKEVIYHEVKIKKTPGGYEAIILFDI